MEQGGYEETTVARMHEEQRWRDGPEVAKDAWSEIRVDTDKMECQRRKTMWSASCAKGTDRLVKRMRTVDLMRKSTTRNAARRRREVGPEYITRRIDFVQLRGSPAVR